MRELGRYQILEEIARGAQGVVYRARVRGLQRDVALKVLLGTEDPKQRARFKREALALSRLRHPNLVEIYDVDEVDGQLYMALELVEGESLQERLDREGALPVSEALRVADAACQAIAHAHAHGLLHRDLKPGNVLLAEDGAVRVTDFGLTRDLVALSQSRLTQTGRLLGTPGYWAPEQARGEKDRQGPPSDVWGLGALLYAMLTGRPPHEGASLVELLAQLDEPVISPAELNQEVPPWLSEVVLCALHRAPQARWSSAADLARALQRRAAPPPRASPSTSAPWLAGGVATLCLLAGLVALVAVPTAPRPPLGPPPAADAPTVSPLARAWALFGRGELEEADAALAEAADQAPPRWDPLNEAARATLLHAWILVARGRPPAQALGALPKVALEQRRELALALVEAADTPEAAAPGEDLLRELSSGSLASVRLELARRRLRGEPASLEELAHLRALTDILPPQAPRGRRELARARLVEGHLLLELGWEDSAAEAFSRALEDLGDARLPLAVSRRGPAGPPVLLPPRLSAALGLARARAGGLDGRMAREACERACELTRQGWPAALGSALLCLGEARGLDGDAAGEREALEAAGKLLDPGPELAAAQARAARRRCDPAGEQAARPTAPALAARSLALGEAELARAFNAGEAEDELHAAVPRARRALLRALGELPPGQRGRLTADLARLAVLEQDWEQARRWLERAQSAAPSSWRTRVAQAELLAGTGQLADSGRAFRKALEALQTDSKRARPLALGADRLKLLDRAAQRLTDLGAPREALPLRVDAARLARGLRLSPPQQEAHFRQLRQAARELQAREEEQLAADWLAELKQRLVRINELLRGPTEAEELRELLAELPSDADTYLRFFAVGKALVGGESFQPLALSAELRPTPVLQLFLNQRLVNEGMTPQERRFLSLRLRALLDPGRPDSHLPFECDEDLARGLVVIYLAELAVDLSPTDLRLGLEAGWRYLARRPGDQTASLVLGRLQVEAGDYAGALAQLERSLHLDQPFKKASQEDTVFPEVFRALALGGMRRWDAAGAALARARQTTGRLNAYPWRLGERLLLDPRFRRVRGQEATLVPQLARQARLLDAKPR